MRIALLMASTALALAGCGSKVATPSVADNTYVSEQNAMVAPNDGNGMASDGMASDGNAMGTETVSTEDFVTKAAMSDMYEIASSKLAATKATTPALKAFAAKMVDGHTATTRELKAAKAKDNVIALPPTALDAEHQALIDALTAAKGADFEALYKTQQTDAHRKTLALMEGYAASGDKPAVKAFAAATAPKVKMHLDMITAM